jgi:hypothetical protein
VPRESLKLAIRGGVPGMTNYEALPTESPRHRCPRCAALFHLTRSILDPQRGNTVLLFQCLACGECRWDGDSGQLAAGLSHFSSSRRKRYGGFSSGPFTPLSADQRLEEDHIEIVVPKCILNPEAQGPTIHELAANCPAPKVPE